MSTQPEALRLAEWWEQQSHNALTPESKTATELRRLHEANQELLAVLKHAAEHAYWTDIERQLYEAIAKAEGDTP